MRAARYARVMDALEARREKKTVTASQAIRCKLINSLRPGLSQRERAHRHLFGQKYKANPI